MKLETKRIKYLFFHIESAKPNSPIRKSMRHTTTSRMESNHSTS